MSFTKLLERIYISEYKIYFKLCFRIYIYFIEREENYNLTTMIQT